MYRTNFLKPFALSLSKGIALRLARYFGTDAQSWLNLQLSYDLKIAEAELNGKLMGQLRITSG